MGGPHMSELLFVVGRQRPEVYESLKRNCVDVENVQVVLDRRQQERRRSASRLDRDRRRSERRELMSRRFTPRRHTSWQACPCSAGSRGRKLASWPSA